MHVELRVQGSSSRTDARKREGSVKPSSDGKGCRGVVKSTGDSKACQVSGDAPPSLRRGNVKFSVEKSGCEKSVDAKPNCDSAQGVALSLLLGVSSFSSYLENVGKAILIWIWLISALWLGKVAKMAGHENLQAIGTIILVWAALFFGIPSLTDIPASLHVLFEIITTTGAVIIGALYFGFWKPEGKAEPIKIEVALPKTPVLDLEPLPHYRGHPLPPSKERGLSGIPLAEAGVTIQKAEPSGYSHPDAKFLKDCQWITLFGFFPPSHSPTPILIAKFGVVQVHCLSGDVMKCKAEIRFRTLEESGKIINGDWRRGGCLNWFSPELKEKLFHTMIGHMPEFQAQLGSGINHYLLNTELDITQGQKKELLLFYMIDANPSVFLCTSLESSPTGVVQNGNPVKFEIEITVTGEGYNPTVWLYRVTALWDDFQIVRVG